MHVLVEAEVGDQPLQPRVLLLELAQPPELTHPEMRVLLLPRIERRPTHPQLPAHVLDGGPGFLLPERVDHLLF